MNYLSLFTGAGGGDLAFQHLLEGFRCVGYVEIEEYCQKVIAQRIKDGLLDEATIFTDIKAFNRDGYAESYQGMVDVVSGGFPCQDISCAGKGAGIKGERSGLWFEMRDTIRIIGPRYVFIENVPMLLVRGFEHVLGSLFKMGYDAKWGIVSAADVGACHLRKRIWIVAQSECKRAGHRPETSGVQGWIAAKAESAPLRQTHRQDGASGIDTDGQNVADPQKKRWRKGNPEPGRTHQGKGKAGERSRSTDSGQVSYANNAGCNQQRRSEPSGQEYQTVKCANWWQSEPAVGRVANGVAHRVDRLRAIGNGQVPIVAATAWKILTE